MFIYQRAANMLLECFKGKGIKNVLYKKGKNGENENASTGKLARILYKAMERLDVLEEIYEEQLSDFCKNKCLGIIMLSVLIDRNSIDGGGKVKRRIMEKKKEIFEMYERLKTKCCNPVNNKPLPKYFIIYGHREMKKKIKKELQKSIVIENDEDIEKLYKIRTEDAKYVIMSPFYKKGNIRILDKSSCLVVKAGKIKKGNVVVDICSSPGSKAIFSLVQLKKKGYMICIEKDRDRCFTLIKELLKNKELIGVYTNESFDESSRINFSKHFCTNKTEETEEDFDGKKEMELRVKMGIDMGIEMETGNERASRKKEKESENRKNENRKHENKKNENKIKQVYFIQHKNKELFIKIYNCDFFDLTVDDFPNNVDVVYIDPSCSSSGMPDFFLKQNLDICLFKKRKNISSGKSMSKHFRKEEINNNIISSGSKIRDISIDCCPVQVVDESASTEELKKIYNTETNGVLTEKYRQEHTYVVPEDLKEKVEMLSVFQTKILKHALDVITSANTFIYSTCSFFEEENEKVIEKVLQENKSFYLEKAGDDKFLLKSEKYSFSKMCVRTYPDEHSCRGIFIAKLKRKI